MRAALPSIPASFFLHGTVPCSPRSLESRLVHLVACHPRPCPTGSARPACLICADPVPQHVPFLPPTPPSSPPPLRTERRRPTPDDPVGDDHATCACRGRGANACRCARRWFRRLRRALSPSRRPRSRPWPSFNERGGEKEGTAEKLRESSRARHTPSYDCYLTVIAPTLWAAPYLFLAEKLKTYGADGPTVRSRGRSQIPLSRRRLRKQHRGGMGVAPQPQAWAPRVLPSPPRSPHRSGSARPSPRPTP